MRSHALKVLPMHVRDKAKTRYIYQNIGGHRTSGHPIGGKVSRCKTYNPLGPTAPFIMDGLMHVT